MFDFEHKNEAGNKKERLEGKERGHRYKESSTISHFTTEQNQQSTTMQGDISKPSTNKRKKNVIA